MNRPNLAGPSWNECAGKEIGALLAPKSGGYTALPPEIKAFPVLLDCGEHAGMTAAISIGSGGNCA